MKQSDHVRWLYRELPELVSQGVLPDEAAQRLRGHYGDPETVGSTAKRWAIVLFSVLGAALIGGGVILLLAHNWENLSRTVRAVIAVAPLAVAAILGAWLLWTENDSAAWREGVGTAQSLSIGVSVALVAQTYNLGGRFDAFMLTWSLLALPIAYLLGSAVPAALYLVGIVVWSGSVANHAYHGLWYFPLMGAALPFVWWTGRVNPYHPRPLMLSWVLAVTVCIGTGFALARMAGMPNTWPVMFGCLFTIQYLLGARWQEAASGWWQRPFQTVGALGAVILALVLSFTDAWPDTIRDDGIMNAGRFAQNAHLMVAAVLLMGTLGVWVWCWGKKKWHEMLVGAVSAMTAVGWITAAAGAAAIGAVMFNLYLFVLGVGTLINGVRRQRLGVVNAGMTVVAAVILCRFFDADLNFIVRGTAFIGIGIGFLATNLMLVRRKGAVKR